jgi:hypothetical protein
MARHRQQRVNQPFPLVRPDITIRPSRARPFAVDYREVPGWFGVPEVGDRTLWCIYDPPDWRLTCVTRMRGVRPASVHGVDCVEIGVDEVEAGGAWQEDTWMMFARLTNETSEWVGNLHAVDGRRRLYTFLDDGFDVDWGDRARHLEDAGEVVSKRDGTYRTRRRKPAPGYVCVGSGHWRVTIGGRGFTCLRTLGFWREPDAHDMLYVAYLERRGRTVLARRYNGRLWHEREKPWDEVFPDHDRIVINGVTYVHWYDCLSHVAVGVDPAAW